MSELTLLILRLGFLVMLWLFVFSVVYSLRSDLFGAPLRRMKKETNMSGRPVAAPPQPVITPSVGAVPAADTSGPAAKLVILTGVAAGTSIPLDEDVLTIGRSPDSTLVIVDEYTSTYHARLQRDGKHWTLIDLDSTNGTKVSGERIKDSVPLPTFTQVTIGTTTFELRP